MNEFFFFKKMPAIVCAHAFVSSSLFNLQEHNVSSENQATDVDVGFFQTPPING